jgi:hypothetical protein
MSGTAQFRPYDEAVQHSGLRGDESIAFLFLTFVQAIPTFRNTGAIARCLRSVAGLIADDWSC